MEPEVHGVGRHGESDKHAILRQGLERRNRGSDHRQALAGGKQEVTRTGETARGDEVPVGNKREPKDWQSPSRHGCSISPLHGRAISRQAPLHRSPHSRGLGASQRTANVLRTRDGGPPIQDVGVGVED